MQNNYLHLILLLTVQNETPALQKTDKWLSFISLDVASLVVKVTACALKIRSWKNTRQM